MTVTHDEVRYVLEAFQVLLVDHCKRIVADVQMPQVVQIMKGARRKEVQRIVGHV